MQTSSNYILLTGPTGLVGRYLVRNLLQRRHRLAVILRSTKKARPAQRLESILQMWESELEVRLPRPVWFEGDVSKPNLGLDADAQGWLASRCDRVIHSAASLEFHGNDRQREPWTTNLDGTGHMLKLCQSLGIRDLHYISTAYVCGRREGLIKEDDLDFGQSFRNDYEHSKLEAEKLVRQADFLDQLTVYRPTVISGDSQTGYTNTYHGLYLYLRLMSLLIPNLPPDENGVRHTDIRLPMTGEEPRNVIPVEWVADVITHLFETRECNGKTFHLAPDSPLTPRGIIDSCCRYFNSTGVEYHGPNVEIPAEEMTDFERMYLSQMTMYETYESTDPQFDTTNLKKYAPHLPCPEIDDATIHRYLQFGESDRWGKRSEQLPQVTFPVGEHLSLVQPHHGGSGGTGNGQDAASTQRSDVSPEFEVGLDVLGPGGGQWRLTMQAGQAIEIERGLPLNGCHVLRIPVDEFANFARGRQQLPSSYVEHHTYKNSPEGRESLNRLLRSLVISKEVGAANS